MRGDICKYVCTRGVEGDQAGRFTSVKEQMCTEDGMHGEEQETVQAGVCTHEKVGRYTGKRVHMPM